MPLPRAFLPAALLAAAGCGASARSGQDIPAAFQRSTAQQDLGASLDEAAPISDGARVWSPAPFVERRVGPGKRETTHVLWPLFSMTRSPEERSVAVRPFFVAESRPGRKDVEVLWPLASWRREGDDRTLVVRPLFMYKRRVRPAQSGREVDTDWMLFPILWGGHDANEGSYFAIFPLGGTIKGQLGKKKMSFFLWPLWLASEDKNYKAFNVMATMGYWKGPDQVGRRLFPFYMANRREGRFDRRYYMWPFVGRWKTGLDTRYPTETTFIFPFYGRITSRFVVDPDTGETTPYRDSRTWLWPFFGKTVKHAARPGERSLVETHWPWPIFGRVSGDGLVARKLWPVWGVRKSNDLRDMFVLWPFYRRSVRHEDDREVRWHNVGLLFNTQMERWVRLPDGTKLPPSWPEGFGHIPDPRLQAGTHSPVRTAQGEVLSRRWTQLWPLFHYGRNERGEVRFQALSLLPRRAQGRAESLWGPFFTLYRYERDATGLKRESGLFGLIRHHRRSERTGRGMRYVNVLGVASYHRRTGVGKSFSILGGLIGYERVGPRKALRLFWFGGIPRAEWDKYEALAGERGEAPSPGAVREGSGR